MIISLSAECVRRILELHSVLYTEVKSEEKLSSVSLSSGERFDSEEVL